MKEDKTLEEIISGKFQGFEKDVSTDFWSRLENNIPEIKEPSAGPVGGEKEAFNFYRFFLNNKLYFMGGLIGLSLLAIFLTKPDKSPVGQSLPKGEEIQVVQEPPVQETFPVKQNDVAIKDGSQKENQTDEVKSESLTKPGVAKIQGTMTERSKKEQILLPSGQTIYMNRGTSFDYLQTEEGLIVEPKGEIYFEATAGKAIMVKTKTAELLVDDAIVFIKAAEDGTLISVIVEKGEVVVTEYPSKKVVLAKKGNEYTATDGRFQLIAFSDPNKIAWQSEKIVFNKTPLKEVVLVLESVYGIPVKLKDPQIGECRFTGTFEKSDLKEILDVLVLTVNLSYNKNDKMYIIEGKGCNK